jgi:hypothetical protein
LEDDDHQRRVTIAREAVGGFGSGRTDTAEQHDEVLAERGW